MKSYRVLLQAPYLACVTSIFNSFLSQEGDGFVEVMKEATEYFEVDAGSIPAIFTTEWNPSGIQPIDLDATDNKHVDILLLTISRSLHLTGVCVGSQQLLKWHQNPKALRKGIVPSQIKKLKVRVKKMSLVWKAEGYVKWPNC